MFLIDVKAILNHSIFVMEFEKFKIAFIANECKTYNSWSNHIKIIPQNASKPVKLFLEDLHLSNWFHDFGLHGSTLKFRFYLETKIAGREGIAFPVFIAVDVVVTNNIVNDLLCALQTRLMRDNLNLDRNVSKIQSLDICAL